MIVLALLLALQQDIQQDTCAPCPIPCARSTDQAFTVRMTGGRLDPPQSFTSIQRDTLHIAGETVQAIRLFWHVDGECRDTLVQAHHVDALVMGRTLGKVPPLHVPILPVREYVRLEEPRTNSNWAELGVFAGYGGPDNSEERPTQIGFNSVYGGADAVVAPFGNLLGDHLSLGVGAGLTFEGGRMRIPVLGQLRWTFSSTETVTSVRFEPNACTFSCPGGVTDTVEVPAGYVQRSGADSVDRSAALFRERVIVADDFAPYVFAEGGLVFNGPFEGAGARPSENPDDYGQYVLGVGAGMPVIGNLHAQLAYRFQRLNLRTPCENCSDLFVLNTNVVHSVVLRVAYHLGW